VVDYTLILAKFYRGERLTRGERKDLETYALVSTARELEHICAAVGGPEQPKEESDAPDDGND
jgi:hypothetical protein